MKHVVLSKLPSAICKIFSFPVDPSGLTNVGEPRFQGLTPLAIFFRRFAAALQIYNLYQSLIPNHPIN